MSHCFALINGVNVKYGDLLVNDDEIVNAESIRALRALANSWEYSNSLTSDEMADQFLGVVDVIAGMIDYRQFINEYGIKDINYC